MVQANPNSRRPEPCNWTRRSLFAFVMHLKTNYAEATNMLAYHLIEQGRGCLLPLVSSIRNYS